MTAEAEEDGDRRTIQVIDPHDSDRSVDRCLGHLAEVVAAIRSSGAPVHTGRARPEGGTQTGRTTTLERGPHRVRDRSLDLLAESSYRLDVTFVWRMRQR